MLYGCEFDLAPYGENGSSRSTVRIIPAHEKYRQKYSAGNPWHGDLRRVQIHSQPPDSRTYSPKVTGVSSAISRFIALRFVLGQTTSLHALIYNIAYPPKCQAFFLAFLQKTGGKFSVFTLHFFVHFDIGISLSQTDACASHFTRGGSPPLELPRAASRRETERLLSLRFTIHIIISMQRPT